MTFTTRTYFILLFLFVGCSNLFGQSISQLGKTKLDIELSNIGIYSSEEEMSPDIVLTKEFIKPESKTINLGATNKTHWVKINLSQIEDADNSYILIDYPLIDQIKAFDISTETPVLITEVGQNLPFSSREVNFKNFVFPLKNFAGIDHKEVLFQIQSGKQIILPLFTVKENDIIELNGLNNLIAGFFSGLILVMLLYNLFIYTTTNDQNYLYYVLFILFLGLTQLALQGFGDMFIWPESAYLSKNGVQIFGSLIGITSILFTKFFLHLRRFLPKINFVLNFLIGIYAVTFILTLSGKLVLSYNIINTSAGLGAILGLVAAIILTVRKNRTAAYFLVAWITFITGIIIYILKDVGVLPFNGFTNNVMLVGSGAEVVLLSFALADKINTYRARMQESQSRALEALRENERIIREQNVILEKRVEERTLELKSANDEISVAYKELKDAQGQLVEAEKMASLGQLTAGIAHEINNPVNFISSNIIPIRNDTNDAFEAFDTIEKEIHDSNCDELKVSVSKIKENFDLDYAKEEVDSLLKGMKEGVERTVEIVRGLRVFSRLDEAEFKPVNLIEGLESTLVLLNNKIKQGIVVEKNFEDIPEIECFGGKMNQVFMNLIVNALQALEENMDTNPNPKLSLGAKIVDSMVEFTIEDNGPGIPKEHLEKIFDPFFTTKAVGKGTGLGLSIVYNIINGHNGDLKVDSKIGEGTKFQITIPIKNDPRQTS